MVYNSRTEWLIAYYQGKVLETLIIMIMSDLPVNIWYWLYEHAAKLLNVTIMHLNETEIIIDLICFPSLAMIK